MNIEKLNKDKNNTLNKTNQSLRNLIKKLDVFSSVKSFVWLAIIYLLIIPFLIGSVIFISYISAHSFPYQEPEISALKLTLVILSAMELSFFFGYLIIKYRKNIERDLKINADVLNNTPVVTKQTGLSSMITLIINFLKMIFICMLAILSSKVCYAIYAFFVVDPPIENFGFGILLFFIVPFVFLFTCLLWVLAFFLEKKFDCLQSHWNNIEELL